MSSVRRRLLAVGIGFAVVTGAGCDPPDAPTVDAAAANHDHDTHDHGTADLLPAIDPCSLVSGAEASTVIGDVALLAEDDPIAVGVVPDQRTCALTLAADPTRGVNIGFTDHDGKAKFADMEKKFPGFAAGVDGLADRAAWFERFRLLLVLDGDWLVSIQLRQPEADPDGRDRAVTLGAMAVAELAGRR